MFGIDDEDFREDFHARMELDRQYEAAEREIERTEERLGSAIDKLHAERDEARARVAELESAALAAAPSTHPGIGLVGLRKLIRDTAATEDVDGWSVDIDDETAERIALAVLACLGLR